MSKLTLFALVLLTACAGSPEPAGTPAPPLPITVDGLATPESAVHDPAADVYLVTSIDGSPFAADGRGHVTRISPDGEILAARWLDGLDAPKGIAVGGDLIAVADLAVLRRFDRTTGAAVDVIAVPGATFLNGVEPDGDGGDFFVSDSGMKGIAEDPGMAPTGTDAIHRVARDGTITTVARGTELAMPNGLATSAGTLRFVGFGGRAVITVGGGAAAHEVGAGFLDGLVITAAGCTLVSSMERQAVLAAGPGAAFAPVLADVTAADLGLDARRGRLLLPLIMQDQLRIVPLPACP